VATSLTSGLLSTTGLAIDLTGFGFVIGLLGLTKGTSSRDISLRGEDEAFAGSVMVEGLALPFVVRGLVLFLFSRSGLFLTSLRFVCVLLGFSFISSEFLVTFSLLLTDLLGFETSLLVAVVVNVVEGCLIGLVFIVFIVDGLLVAPSIVVVGLLLTWLSLGFLIISPELRLLVGDVLLRPFIILEGLLFIVVLCFCGDDLDVDVGFGSKMLASLIFSLGWSAAATDCFGLLMG